MTVNVPDIAGEMSAYLVEARWFPAIHVAANACANTVLVKRRRSDRIAVASSGRLDTIAATAGC